MIESVSLEDYCDATFVICWPQHVSPWGMSAEQGHGFSYTSDAPHFSHV